jgi:hypothetical protein
MLDPSSPAVSRDELLKFGRVNANIEHLTSEEMNTNIEHSTPNIEHRTEEEEVNSNIEHRTPPWRPFTLKAQLSVTEEATNWEDPIVREVRDARHRLAARFDNDLQRVADDLILRQVSHGSRLVAPS